MYKKNAKHVFFRDQFFHISLFLTQVNQKDENANDRSLFLYWKLSVEPRIVGKDSEIFEALVNVHKLLVNN